MTTPNNRLTPILPRRRPGQFADLSPNARDFITATQEIHEHRTPVPDRWLVAVEHCNTLITFGGIRTDQAEATAALTEAYTKVPDADWHLYEMRAITKDTGR